MRTLGVVGGLGPESTTEYYRLLIAAYRSRVHDDSYPAIVITSLDVNQALRLVGALRYQELAEYFLGGVRQLARAGADFGLISANTPHIVFDEVQRGSPIPLLSIVEAACAEARQRKMKTVALLGTRFTMQARFYPDVFARQGIGVITPRADEQEYIHEKYVGELLVGRILDSTRERLLQIICRMRDEDRVEGILLAGTELPLILRQEQVPDIPLLDTTQIHVEAAITRLME